MQGKASFVAPVLITAILVLLERHSPRESLSAFLGGLAGCCRVPVAGLIGRTA